MSNSPRFVLVIPGRLGRLLSELPPRPGDPIWSRSAAIRRAIDFYIDHLTPTARRIAQGNASDHDHDQLEKEPLLRVIVDETREKMERANASR